MKIFLGLTEIAGYFSNLKKGFESLGIKTTFIDISENPFKYSGNDNDIFLVKLILSVKKNKGNLLNKLLIKFFTIIDRFLRLILFIYLVFTHDVFIFGFATTFFSYKELKILKLLNKKIIYVFLGSDSRPPYLDGAVMSKDANLTINDCINLTFKTKKNLTKINKYADVIIDSIPFSLFHEKKIVSWLNIGMPFSSDYQPEKSNELVNKDADTTVRILHSPSSPEAKGTSFIREYINNLKEKGYNIDYIEVIGKPNSYVIEKINECDFIIDQLYCDTPMGGIVTEAAFFGKPAVVGGYYSDYVKKEIKEEDIPPSYYCHPDKLQDSIEYLIKNREFRIKLGEDAKRFVREKWSPEAVAKKYLKIIKNEIEESWFFEPSNIDYIYGGCIKKEKIKDIVKKIIEISGKDALKLSDKPKLEKLLLDFVNE